MRFDPRLSREEMAAALMRDAQATWGEAEAEGLRGALDITAGAIWLVAQERLDATDTEPWGVGDQ